jgi:hypothetical protein
MCIEEAASYPGARFYSTGAVLFDRLQKWGLPWAHLPDRLRGGYRHLGHMSWGSEHEDLITHVNRQNDYVRARLAGRPTSHGMSADGG